MKLLNIQRPASTFPDEDLASHLPWQVQPKTGAGTRETREEEGKEP